MEAWMKEIPGSESWTSVREISYGWSGERKMHIRREGGEDLLLRVSDGEKYEKMLAIHTAMQPLNALALPASRAVDCGRAQQGALSWALLTYIDGEDLEGALPELPEEEQYRLGREAGAILRRIHGIPAPQDRTDWAAHFGAKMDRKRRRWHEVGFQAEGCERAFAFIDERRPLLAGRAQSLQHGDYHCGNMVLTPDGHVGVIDFNRLDWGDPWEEFNRIVWDVRASHAFAAGQIDGYFAPEAPPALFWELLALYVTCDQISALPWAVQFGEGELEIALQNFQAVRSWYDDFRTTLPSWYAPRRENGPLKK
ncbi:MAG: phosphotransferase [Eubacteriales bacterium]|nr:phosphotransferase [Eubacteriales bacterium]